MAALLAAARRERQLDSDDPGPICAGPSLEGPFV
jgi:hypothetical protein